jgi:hypothetical protein
MRQLRTRLLGAAVDTVDPTTEKVLIDNIPSPDGNHNAGERDTL